MTMDTQYEAQLIIDELRMAIDELRRIANGYYCDAEAKDKLQGIKLSLDYT
jgi:hypothetical protein